MVVDYCKRFILEDIQVKEIQESIGWIRIDYIIVKFDNCLIGIESNQSDILIAV